MTHRTELEIDGGISAPAAAREKSMQQVRRASPALAEAVERDLRLLVSELVANAVLHGGAQDGEPVRLEVQVDGKCVRVAVTDPGRTFLARGESGYGGWGLELVERVACSWGIERRDGMTTVWFELHESQPEATVRV